MDKWMEPQKERIKIAAFVPHYPKFCVFSDTHYQIKKNAVLSAEIIPSRKKLYPCSFNYLILSL